MGLSIVSKEDRRGVPYFISSDGRAFLEPTLRENWRPATDPHAGQKAWAKKHGYTWKDP